MISSQLHYCYRNLYRTHAVYYIPDRDTRLDNVHIIFGYWMAIFIADIAKVDIKKSKKNRTEDN